MVHLLLMLFRLLQTMTEARGFMYVVDSEDEKAAWKYDASTKMITLKCCVPEERWCGIGIGSGMAGTSQTRVVLTDQSPGASMGRVKQVGPDYALRESADPSFVTSNVQTKSDGLLELVYTMHEDALGDILPTAQTVNAAKICWAFGGTDETAAHAGDKRGKKVVDLAAYSSTERADSDVTSQILIERADSDLAFWWWWIPLLVLFLALCCCVCCILWKRGKNHQEVVPGDKLQYIVPDRRKNEKRYGGARRQGTARNVARGVDDSGAPAGGKADPDARRRSHGNKGRRSRSSPGKGQPRAAAEKDLREAVE